MRTVDEQGMRAEGEVNEDNCRDTRRHGKDPLRESMMDVRQITKPFLRSRNVVFLSFFLMRTADEYHLKTLAEAAITYGK